MVNVFQKTLNEDLIDAYLKFKSYVYHENFSIALKLDLAAYEKNFDKNIRSLHAELIKIEEGKRSLIISGKINRISYHLMPKKLDSKEYDNNSGNYFSNENVLPEYSIGDLKNLMPFIKCDIDLHIIATYWVVKIGAIYEKALPSSCYANRLYDLKKYRKTDRLKLFKRYYVSYNKWRDTAIKTAKEIHNEGQDVAILNLDIKSYYHSIDMDLDAFSVSKQYKWLNNILKNIHNSYLKRLKADSILESPIRRILPIGLISSNVLANVYLSELDSNIIPKISPAFYGRYVDDIIFVFRNPKINESNHKIVHDFIDQNIAKRRGRSTAYIARNEKDPSSFRIHIRNNDLLFQLSKVRLYYFKSSDDISLIKEFENEIRRHSSEFRLQLDEEELNDPFEESLYTINYSDTINKLRSVDGFSPNKFAASKQLSRIIAVAKYINGNPAAELSQVSEKIIDFFRGKRSIELNNLWERSFIYFVLIRDVTGLIKLFTHILGEISKVQVKISKRPNKACLKYRGQLQQTLVSQLTNSLSVAFALNIGLLEYPIMNKIKRIKTNKEVGNKLKELSVSKVKAAAFDIVQANLFNHSMVAYPLLNYCIQQKSYCFTDKTIHQHTNFSINQRKLELSPRYINFHEVQTFSFMKANLGNDRPGEKQTLNTFPLNKDLYNKLNNLEVRVDDGFFNLNVETRGKHIEVSAGASSLLETLRIGLANFKLGHQTILDNLNGKVDLSLSRLKSLNKVLNSCIEDRVNLVIFPEVSIPFAWLNKLSEFSKRNNIAVICGLEHVIYNHVASNYVCTILPFKDGWYTNALVDLRLKIDYSPKEKEEIQKLKLNEPSHKDLLRLYNWRGIYFSVFNCFELSDIEKRSYFRGKVDAMFTVEYNQDTIYFSNINESYARDIHAYMIQVNSANFGDSRITLPASSIIRDYIKIKGGENVSLIVGDIDIKKLRDFQRSTYEEQKNNKIFKPIPPNYVISPKRR